MIKILGNWDEIGAAVNFLGRQKLPRHGSAEKCWDLYHLHQVARDLPRSAPVIDLGCSGLHVLKFLHALGFSDLLGVDLNVTGLDRALRLRLMAREKTWRPPFRLRRGDLTRTHLPDASFNLATCVSVIEHGVDVNAFLAEAARLLRPGGRLFITADYWEEPLAPVAAGEFGLPWRILTRLDIEALLQTARELGLNPIGNSNIPNCAEKCVYWNGRDYTFITLGLRKGAS